jgi:tellurite resistance protein TerC
VCPLFWRSERFFSFSSNIFCHIRIAIHVFLLANMLEKFSYLEFSIAILSFVGLKMLLHEFIEIPEWASLVLLPFLFW